MSRLISAIGPVERTHRTEKVYCVYDPDTLRPALRALSVNTGKARDLLALSVLADEDWERAIRWVLSCGSTLVM